MVLFAVVNVIFTNQIQHKSAALRDWPEYLRVRPPIVWLTKVSISSGTVSGLYLAAGKHLHTVCTVRMLHPNLPAPGTEKLHMCCGCSVK